MPDGMEEKHAEPASKTVDLGSLIDEKIRFNRAKLEQLNKKVDEFCEKQTESFSRIAVLEAKMNDSRTNRALDDLDDSLTILDRTIIELDKRITSLEVQTNKHDDRWRTIYRFILDISWIVIVAYVLTKMHLQAPVIP